MGTARVLPFRLCEQREGDRCGRGAAHSSHAVWRRQFANELAAGVEAYHVTNFKLRTSSRNGTGPLVPLMSEAVHRAVRTAGGPAALSADERKCVGVAHSLIQFMWGDPDAAPVDEAAWTAQYQTRVAETG